MQEESETSFEQQLEAAITNAISFEDYRKYKIATTAGGVAGEKLAEYILGKFNHAILIFPPNDELFKKYYQVTTARLGLPSSMFSKHFDHERKHRDSLLEDGVEEAHINYAFVFAEIEPN